MLVSLITLHCQIVGAYLKLPTEWSSHEKVAENFASFYRYHVGKGKYTMNADGKVSVSTDDGMLVLSCNLPVGHVDGDASSL